MHIVRSVSGHVCSTHCLTPAPLRSLRVTGVHRYYGRLRLPVTFHPTPRCLDLLWAAHSSAPATGSPRLPHTRPSSSIGSTIPGGHRLLACYAHDAVACWRLETIGPFPRGHFGTTTFTATYPSPFHLACFRAYASSKLLPTHLQGSIPGLWLAVTRAGIPPARVRDIAMPQPRPDPIIADHPCCSRAETSSFTRPSSSRA